jgi:hypothetical protein
MDNAVVRRLLDDDVVHEHLSEAVRHTKAAVVRATGAEKPRKTHRVRTLVVALAAAAGTAAVVNRYTAGGKTAPSSG